jgi:putative ABC transport system ATP-binding protein
MSGLSVDGSPTSGGASKLAAPLVVAEDLGRTYHTGSNDVHALRGVSLAVPRGTLVAVRGRSGSGKTTLLILLGGLDRPDTDRVTVDGREVSTLSEDELVEVRRRTVGFVFQSFGLIPILSAAENVGVPLRLIRTDPQEREERVRLLLSLVGLADAAAQRPYELSGGQQQRLAIARALANRPPLLLADEPTGQLDSQTGRMIMELLRALVRSQGITALVATHDPTLLAVADRVIELRDGALVSVERAVASLGVERHDTGHTGRP